MLIITGTGRCGTSLLAKHCQDLGFDPGGGWENRVNAGYEDATVVRINNDLHDHPRTDATNRIAAVKKRVIKDPRFLMYKEVLPAWRARPHLKFVLMVRSLTDVLASVEEDPKRFRPQAGQSHAELLADFVIRVTEYGYPFRTLHFPSCLENYQRVYNVLTFGGLEYDFDYGARRWDKLTDWNKVHHRSSF